MTSTRAEGFTRADLDAFPRDPGRTYRLDDGAIVVCAPGGLARVDRDALPAFGARQELIDGEIVVNASPSTRHQDIVLALARLLADACPRATKVLVGPFDVQLTEATVIEPDIVVARRADVTDRDLPVAPLLTVEVLSPSTRRVDLGRKRDRLAEAGCPSYWIVAPGGGQVEPSLTVLGLTDGATGPEYAEVALVTGDESWTAERPFPVTIVPNDLLDD